jgi:hypothetical protein
MNKGGLILGLLCTLGVQSFSASAQSIRYSRFYDSNSGAEILDEAVLLNNGSLLIAGKTSNSNGSGFGKAFNLVVDEEGTLQHSHVWEENQVTIGPYAIVRTWNGGIYEAGTRHDHSVPSLGTGDFFLAKLDQTGDTLFTKVYARPDTSDYLLDIVQSRPNKLILIGWTYNDTTNTDADLMFITVDTLGNELNRVVWGGAGTDYVRANTLLENGDVLMTGYTTSFNGNDNDTWIVKTDSIGNVLSYEVYNHLSPSGADAGSVILNCTDGGHVISGSFETSQNGESDIYVMKIDAVGNEVWTNRLEIPRNQGFWSGHMYEDGNMLFSGQTTYTDDDSQAGWLIKTDEHGDTLWTRTYNPSPLIDRLLNMLVMPNGDIVMVGSGRAPGQTNQDGWILRVDSMGCLEEGCHVVGVEEQLSIYNGQLSIWPNPAGEVVRIGVTVASLWQSYHVTVTDMLGREVLNHELRTPNFERNVMDWPNGIYLISLSGADGSRESQRLVVRH